MGPTYSYHIFPSITIADPAPPRNIEVTDRELTNLEVSFDPSFSSADYYVGECVPVNDNEEDDEEDATEGKVTS